MHFNSYLFPWLVTGSFFYDNPISTHNLSHRNRCSLTKTAYIFPEGQNDFLLDLKDSNILHLLV